MRLEGGAVCKRVRVQALDLISSHGQHSFPPPLYPAVNVSPLPLRSLTDYSASLAQSGPMVCPRRRGHTPPHVSRPITSEKAGLIIPQTRETRGQSNI